jgi:hypothetical protein
LTASAGRTPNWAATASAVAALPMLTVPGSWSRTWCHAPVGSTTPSSSTTHCGLGRRSVQLVHHQSPSARSIAPPHSGQTQESSCQRWPALNQETSGEAIAAQVTIGSSALATTCTAGCAARAVRHSWAIIATSFARSSWSRERLRSATARGEVSSRTRAR